jgi:hypothetical protein
LIEFDVVSEDQIKKMLKDLDIKYENTYDSELSETSTNAVQNQAVTKKFKELDDKNKSINLKVENIIENTPFEKGEGENSAVLKGGDNQANGDFSIAEGIKSVANGFASHAEGGYYGKLTTENGETVGYLAGGMAVGSSSHAEGIMTKAIGLGSHAQNYKTEASGEYSHAENYHTIALGDRSHAEGSEAEASGEMSHAEGFRTKAIGKKSHAENNQAMAEGISSHAEGTYTKAIGENSHAEGYKTIANNDAEHASGKFNNSIAKTESNTEADATLYSIGIGTSNKDRKNAVEVKQNGDVYIIGIGGYDGTNTDVAKDVTTAISLRNIKHAELKSLRDANKLIPGQQYRITDYKTLALSVDKSILPSACEVIVADNDFDIIVTATSTNTLDENAKAIQKSNTTYFNDSNLNAWEIKYCLDNDSNRFMWALQEYSVYVKLDESSGLPNEVKGKIIFPSGHSDNTIIHGSLVKYCYDLEDGSQIYFTTNGRIYSEAEVHIGNYSTITGKGCIYYMKDEFNNECSYDFKNIKFKYKDAYYYTFHDKYTPGDASISNKYCYSNVIKPNNPYGKYNLNGNIFIIGKDSYCYGNEFGPNCINNIINSGVGATYKNDYKGGSFNNHFGHTCTDIILGDGNYKNVFGDNCRNITFVRDCYKNTIGSNGLDITLQESCNDNVFENNVSNIYFGKNCVGNTIKLRCNKITFLDECKVNYIGSYAELINLGKSCRNNIIADSNTGSYSAQITFKDFSSYNNIGFLHNKNTTGTTIIEGDSNTIGNSCSSIKIEGVYNIIGDNCKYIELLDDSKYNNISHKCSKIYFSTCLYNYLGFECTNFNLSKIKYSRFGNGTTNPTLEPKSEYVLEGGEFDDPVRKYLENPILIKLNANGGNIGNAEPYAGEKFIDEDTGETRYYLKYPNAGIYRLLDNNKIYIPVSVTKESIEFYVDYDGVAYRDTVFIDGSKTWWDEMIELETN